MHEAGASSPAPGAIDAADFDFDIFPDAIAADISTAAIAEGGDGLPPLAAFTFPAPPFFLGQIHEASLRCAPTLKRFDIDVKKKMKEFFPLTPRRQSAMVEV
jgi:hypothetical protein